MAWATSTLREAGASREALQEATGRARADADLAVQDRRWAEQTFGPIPDDFEALAAWHWSSWALAGEGPAGRVEGTQVSRGYFRGIGVETQLGRT